MPGELVLSPGELVLSQHLSMAPCVPRVCPLLRQIPARFGRRSALKIGPGRLLARGDVDGRGRPASPPRVGHREALVQEDARHAPAAEAGEDLRQLPPLYIY